MLRICFLRKNRTIRALFVSRTALAQMYPTGWVQAADDEEIDYTSIQMTIEATLASGNWEKSRAVKMSLDDFVR